MSDKVPFSNVLVYLDGSEGSLSAAMYAVLMAKATGARLHALYCVNTKALGDLVKARIFVSQEKAEYLEDLNKDARRHVRHVEKLAGARSLEVETRIVEGSPSAEVNRYVKECGIDLLTASTLGRSVILCPALSTKFITRHRSIRIVIPFPIPLLLIDIQCCAIHVNN